MFSFWIDKIHTEGKHFRLSKEDNFPMTTFRF